MKTKQAMIYFLILGTSICAASDLNIITNYASLAAISDAPYLILSNETNSLKSGLFIENTNHIIHIQDGKMKTKFSLAMLNTSTNDVYFFYPWYKSPRSEFEISMTDQQGRAVVKTTLGRLYEEPELIIPPNTPTSKAKQNGLAMDRLQAKGDGLFQLDFEQTLQDCFIFKAPGDYKFTLVHHIYVPETKTNGIFLKPITFSPITVTVRVKSQAQ